MKPVRFLALSVLAGCSLAPEGLPPGPPTSGEQPGDGTTQEQAFSLRGEEDASDQLARRFAIELEGSAPVELICDEVAPPYEQHRVTVDPAEFSAFTLRGFKADTTYRCVASVAADALHVTAPVEFTTPPLPDDLILPEVMVAADDPAEIGYTLFNVGLMNPNVTYDANYLVLLDAEGIVRWFYRGIGGGDIDVSYVAKDMFLYGGAATDINYAPTVIGLDKKSYFQGTSAISSSTEWPGFYHHDAGISSTGRSLMAMVIESLPDASWWGFIVKEIDLETNAVIWTWESIANGVNSGYLQPGSDTNNDPYHANSVYDRFENNHRYVYISLKHTNQVLKIDYETKQVVWKLGVGGDFQLLEKDGTPAADDRWFYWQHDAKYIGNRMTVYDNGTTRPGGDWYSRALVLDLDENARTAQISFEYRGEGWSESAWGGFDVLPNGTSLLAIGHCWLCDGTADKSSLRYLDSTGQELWRADLRNERAMLYRAEHIDGCAVFHNATYCDAL